MKWYLLIPLLMVSLITNAAFCQEFEERDIDVDLENAERHMHMRKMEMQLQQEEAEMRFQQQMRELELQSRRMDLENAEMARAQKMQAEKMKLENAKKAMAPHKGLAPHKKDAHPLLAVCLFICIIVHILTAIWVYQDIRKRNAGSGIWIVIALLTGLPGTLVYAVVRLGEKQT